MTATSQESQEAVYDPVPLSAYEDIYSDHPRIPRASAIAISEANIPSFLDGHTPEEITESIEKRERAVSQRKAAIETGNVIEFAKTPKETVITTDRALLRYGHEVATEQGLPIELADAAEIQINDLIAEQDVDVIDVPSLALGALALVRMEQTDTDPIERKAATLALGSLPRDPEKIEILRQQELGHDTGELALRAIMEHDPISA